MQYPITVENQMGNHMEHGMEAESRWDFFVVDSEGISFANPET